LRAKNVPLSFALVHVLPPPGERQRNGARRAKAMDKRSILAAYVGAAALAQSAGAQERTGGRQDFEFAYA
jgi:hypothetical protein